MEYVYVVVGNSGGNVIVYGVFASELVALNVKHNLIMSDIEGKSRFYIFTEILER